MQAPGSRDELAWLLDFMGARRRGMPQTGDRCSLWESIVERENYALARPFQAYRGPWGSYIV